MINPLNEQRKYILYDLLNKIPLAMRMTLLLLCVFAFQLHSELTYSQQTKISLNMKNSSIEKILQTIEEKSEFYFLYNSKLIDIDRKIDIRVKDESIASVLNRLFGFENVEYEVKGKQIILHPKEMNRISSDVIVSLQQQDKKSLTGKVTDQYGEPLPGVTIMVAGTTTGTISDADGSFSLTLPTGATTLQFTFVGMQTQEIPIAGRTSFDVVMLDETIALEEIVAIGYGVTRKSDLVGSVSNIKDERLMDKPSFDLGTALQGKVSGVEIVRQQAGRPGAPVQVRIRGINSINSSADPLYVVDGIVGISDPLTNLNPNDIESIDVLKDASASAIYGARGANGVILITTKKGKAGKITVEYGHSTSYSTMLRHFYPLDADELMYVYVQAMNNADKFGTGIDRAKDFRRGYATGLTFDDLGHLFKEVAPNDYVVDLIGASGKYYAPRWNTAWEDYAYKPSFSHNDNISIRGGSGPATFAVSLRRGDEQGLMLNSFAKRYSGKFDLNLKLSDWLTFTSMVMISRNKYTTEDDDRITRNTAESWSILPPGRYPDDPEVYGNYAGIWSSNRDFNVGEQWYPPTTIYEHWDGYKQSNAIAGSVAITAKITDNLTFDSNFSIDTSDPREVFWGSMYFDQRGDVRIRNWDNFYWQNENYFNYSNIFNGVHNLNMMVGLSWSERTQFANDMRNRDFFDDFYKWNNIGVGAAVRPEVNSSNTKSALNSYFARAAYSFANKYYLTFTGRIDGSSKFGTKNKYGFFPSVGLAWRINEESFMRDAENISNLRLRASIGQTGNQEIGSYVTQQFLGTVNVPIGGSVVTGFYPKTVGNDRLKWETTTQSNLGLELGLWNNRVNLEFDVYYKKTTDMLMDVDTPRSTTVGVANMNYGSVENKGVEFTIRTFNINRPNFTWNSSLVFSLNKNKILQLGPTGADRFQDTGAGKGAVVYREGEPIGSWFGLVRLGTYSTEEATLAAIYGLKPGDLKFQDTNGDGQINLLSDGVILGRAYPDWVATLNNGFTYKNFDASMDIRFVYGGTKVNINESAEDRQLVSGGKNSILRAWTPYAQNTPVAQVRPGNAGAPYQSFPDSHGIEDTSHIRGQSLTIGYTLPKSLIHRINIENLRVYFNAENFFLLTDVVGYDPEGSSPDKTHSLKINEDKYQYPRPTVFSLGFNISF